MYISFPQLAVCLGESIRPEVSDGFKLNMDLGSLIFILYVGKALFKLVLLFNNFHLGWPVTMENWDRRL